MRMIDADRLQVVLEKNFGHTGGASVLEQLINEQPTIQPIVTDTNVGDTISRQAAIDALDCISGVEEVLRNLPSVQPESSDKFIPPEQLAIKLGTATIRSAMQWIEFCNALEFLGYAIVERRTE